MNRKVKREDKIRSQTPQKETQQPKLTLVFKQVFFIRDVWTTASSQCQAHIEKYTFIKIRAE